MGFRRGNHSFDYKSSVFTYRCLVHHFISNLPLEIIDYDFHNLLGSLDLCCEILRGDCEVA
jgi:hypothetical protein